MQSVPPAHGPSDASVLQFPVPYEERYRWTPTMVADAALGAASLLTAILVPAMPLLFRVPLALAGTAGAASCVAYAASRKVAFRVDHKGVTLGGGPFRYEAHTSFFPWEGVHAVVLWRRTAPPRWPALRWPALRMSVWYVSVQRHSELAATPPGESGLSGPTRPCRDQDAQRPAPDDLKAGATRGMRAFRVDYARLAVAIATFAPTVQLIKLA
ncbi:MAG TPA: hypothetical protein VI365_13495 [Trebonia sp.]